MAYEPEGQDSIPGVNMGVFRILGLPRAFKQVLAKRAGCMRRDAGRPLCPPLGNCETALLPLAFQAGVRLTSCVPGFLSWKKHSHA